MAQSECKPRLVHPWFRATRVDKTLLYCRCQGHQQRASLIGTALAKKAPYPTLRSTVRIRVASRHKRQKIGQLVFAIRKRIGCSLGLDLQIGEVRWRVLQPYIAGK